MVESLYSVVSYRHSCPIAHNHDLMDLMAVRMWDHSGPLLSLVQHSSDQFSPCDCVVNIVKVIMATHLIRDKIPFLALLLFTLLYANSNC